MQEIDDHIEYKFNSTREIVMKVSGKITCEACNKYGCDSKTENIIVPGKNIFLPIVMSNYGKRYNYIES